MIKKIKTAEEIAVIVGTRPRNLTVAMCHGTFDIVHPGHIRHLCYVKDRADILVASLTADRHVTKANYRPFVPQDMRAFNLAALEVVDYVLIDNDPQPLRNIAIIKPDIFAKGYDYSSDHSPRTAEERDVVEGYGGTILFTPGDVVYSSSKILDVAKPSLAVDKLAALLGAEKLSFEHLKRALSSVAGVRVHVVGDTIVDGHINCALIGSSGKTPTLSVRRVEDRLFVGGAAIVAQHLKAAGADVRFTTVLGGDAAGKFVLDSLKESGVDCQPIIDASRPTTLKETVVCSGHSLLKLDTVDNRPIDHEQIKAQIKEPADIVIFSDFKHGIFSRETTPRLIGAIPKTVFTVADSQVASRWGNILDFKGFDLITPNEREARFALGDQDSVVRPLGSELYRRANCGTLILKLGERGCLTYRSADDDARAFFALDSFADTVVDAVGSGDALLAYASLTLFATKNPVIASALGSLAAAIACEMEGNIPVQANDVLARIDRVAHRCNYTAAA